MERKRGRKSKVRFEVLSAVNVKITVLWHVVSCSLIDTERQCTQPKSSGRSLNIFGLIPLCCDTYIGTEQDRETEKVITIDMRKSNTENRRMCIWNTVCHFNAIILAIIVDIDYIFYQDKLSINILSKFMPILGRKTQRDLQNRLGESEKVKFHAFSAKRVHQRKTNAMQFPVARHIILFSSLFGSASANILQ
jgi:hypothetical protein